MNQDWLEIRQPAAARLLLSENAFRALSPFFDAARSLSEGAARLGWKLPRMSAWVQRLLSAGLLRVDHLERRAGSSIKRYRTVAAVFYLQYDGLDAEVLDAFRQRMGEQLEATLDWAVRRGQGGAYGLQVRGDPFGGTLVAQVPALNVDPVVDDPARPPVLSVWTNLMLSEEDARAFKMRLNMVLEEFRGRRGAGRYLLRLGFASLDG